MSDGARSILLDGIRIDAVDFRQLVQRVRDGLREGRGGTIVTPNIDHLYRAGRDPSWRTLLAEADLAVADGVPLLWAARLAGTPLPGRMNGTDLAAALAATASEAGWSIALLGGAGDAAAATAAAWRQRHPALVVALCASPQVGADGQPEDPGLLAQLASAAPRLVLVGLGSPKQERFIALARRCWPTAWYIGIGVSFSFLAGRIPRAPAWMQRSGLEWCWRLGQEPGRLAGRYARNAPYAAGLLARSLAGRFSRRR